MADLTLHSPADLLAAMAAGDLIVRGDNLLILPAISPGSIQLIYIDPPFNTGEVQRRSVLTTVADAEGDRTGFGGKRYRTEASDAVSYSDRFDDYLEFLAERLVIARALLTVSGTIYVHIDPRESHYVKILMDGIFGRDCFVNEVIWAYDYGGRPRNRWPAKHDTILVYARTPGGQAFYQDAIERIPYMAPGLVTPAKAERGKVPTDVWWHTIVPTNGREKTGYPTQKPEGVLRRIVLASSAPGDMVLDFFAGSGTTGAVAAELGRRFVMIDESEAAVAVMRTRLPGARVAVWSSLAESACRI